MRDIPSGSEPLLDLFPVFRSGRTGQIVFMEFIKYGPAYLEDEQWPKFMKGREVNDNLGKLVYSMLQLSCYVHTLIKVTLTQGFTHLYTIKADLKTPMTLTTDNLLLNLLLEMFMKYYNYYYKCYECFKHNDLDKVTSYFYNNVR